MCCVSCISVSIFKTSGKRHFSTKIDWFSVAVPLPLVIILAGLLSLGVFISPYILPGFTSTGDALKNFVIFTGKHLCWSHVLIKLQACKFIEKRLQHWYFPWHVRKFLRTPVLKNISGWLLLIILLVHQFICFRMSLYNYKEKLIFR